MGGGREGGGRERGRREGEREEGGREKGREGEKEREGGGKAGREGGRKGGRKGEGGFRGEKKASTSTQHLYPSFSTHKHSLHLVKHHALENKGRTPVINIHILQSPTFLSEVKLSQLREEHTVQIH